MKQIHDMLLDKAHELYEQGGQDAVLSFAVEQGLKNWAWCEPCEYKSPMSRDTCLVCWTVKESK